MTAPVLVRRACTGAMHAIIAMVVMSATLAISASALGAQAIVRGVVFDSLITHAPLENATVVVQGTTQTALTDRRGRFVLRDLAPGRYALGFFHPMLDSLDIAAPARLVDVGAAGQQEIELATPSANGVSRLLCGRAAEASTAVLFGTLRAAEDGTPLLGAEASVRWFEVQIIGGRARQIERTARDTTGTDGRYLLCGVPNDIALTLVATHRGQSTGPLYLELDSVGVARRPLTISFMDPAARILPDADPDDTVAVGRIAGLGRLAVRVRDGGGAAVGRAIVGVRGTAFAEVTDDSGRATLRGLPSGSQTLVVRAIGRSPAMRSIALEPLAEVRIDVVLARFAVELPSVSVVGRRADPLTADISRRMRAGAGHLVEGKELADFAFMPGAWARIPGVTVGASRAVGDADPLPLMRGSMGARCVADIWLDGIRMARLNGWELRGMMLNAKRVEVYNTSTRVPPEFTTVSSDPCGAVVIWTR